jgi:phosphoglycerate dehydrogenase-like enzyme
MHALNDRLTVLISLTAHDWALDRIRKICPKSEIRVGPWIVSEEQRMSAELTKGADVLLCELPPANFDDFDRLKWIQLSSAGYTQVLKLPILERGIRVTNGLGNFDGPIAEWNIMMMLMWQREMLDQLANQKNKIWDRDARYQRDCYKSTIGFWGYGGIARETARLAKAMHLNIWVMTRDARIKERRSIYRVEGTGDPEGRLPDRVFGPAQMEEFLGGLDYLFLGMALTPATTGLIDEKALRMLKPSAVLINPTRAAIIEEQAFVQCLQEKWIRGASLDVHYAYPLPTEHPLWSIPNLIMTPHISGSAASPNFLDRIYDIFTQNLERFVAQKTLLNELTTEQLQGR